MKRTILTSILLCLSFASHAADIAAENWSAGRQKALDSRSDLQSQAQNLLAKLMPNADLVPPIVGEARFVDLDGDGGLELVATVDYSGRGFFSNVVVVQRRQGVFSWIELRSNGRSIEDLKSHLIDVDGDGKPELVIDRFMDRYEGSEQVPIETVVYRWQKHGFKDDSEAVPEFYRTKVVPGLEKRLTEALDRPSSSSRPQDDYEVFLLKTELQRAKQRGRIK